MNISNMIKIAIMGASTDDESKDKMIHYLENLEDDKLFLETLETCGIRDWENYSIAKTLFLEKKSIN